MAAFGVAGIILMPALTLAASIFIHMKFVPFTQAWFIAMLVLGVGASVLALACIILYMWDTITRPRKIG